MAILIWLGLGAFLSSLVLTPVIRDVFRIYDIVDRPDSGRKTHAYAIPRVGGIAVAISYLSASFFMPAQPSDAGLSLVVQLLPAAGIVFIIGLIDDFVGLKPWHKLGGETVAALLAYWAGARVTTLTGSPVPTWVSFVVTIVWLLVCTNAFNLVDGLDGLAAGIGFLATLTIFIGALVEGNVALCMATAPLAGCLLAFLCYNFNPATIFLGDCGSLLVGFLLGCYGVVWSQKSLAVLGILAPLIAFSVPLLDVVLSVLRRFLRGRPIFSPDRGHIHHRLIDRGLSPRRVVLTIYGICGIAAAFALVQSLTRSHYVALLAAALFLFGVRFAIGYLRYSEFSTLGRILSVRKFQKACDSQLVLEKFAAELLAARTPGECWDGIRTHYADLGFAAAQLEWNGVLYRDWPPHVAEPEYWSIRIPFSEHGCVVLARAFGSEDTHSIIVPLVNAMHCSLSGNEPRKRMAAGLGRG